MADDIDGTGDLDLCHTDLENGVFNVARGVDNAVAKSGVSATFRQTRARMTT